MKIVPTIVCILMALWMLHGQKQCFNKKPVHSEAGPLKMALTDPIKNFQSGSYSILNKNPQDNKRFTCFNITFMYINSRNNYQVVASIENVQNYQDKEGLDFSVRFSPNPSFIEGLFIMSKTATWTSVSIHYVISSREDFRVGTFVPETVQFLPCGKQASEIILNHKLIKGWNASKKLVFGLPFLSGIRTIDRELNINFNKSTFDPETSLLQIPVSFQNVQSPVEYLLISYLIVTMDSEFQITNIYDLDYIPADINVFVGMTGVKTGLNNKSIFPVKPVANTTGNTKVLKTAASNRTVANKNLFREFFQVQGLVIQSTSNLDVLFSTGNYLQNSVIQCISAEKCQKYDGYMKYYQNQAGFVFRSECILCEKFASYNPATNRCECRDLYLRLNDNCVPKDTVCDKVTQVYNIATKKCECAVNYTDKNGVCLSNAICPPGFSFFKGNCYKITKSQDNLIPSTSTTSTSVNSVSNKSQNCQLPLIWNNQTKSCQCPINYYFDQANKKCIKCKQNEVWSQNTKICECMNGSFRINGACEFCSSQGFFNGTGCQCLPRFVGNGKICRADPKFANQTLGLSTNILAKANDKASSGIGNLNKELDFKPIVLGQISLN